MEFSQFSVVHQEPELFIASQWQHDKFQPNFKYLFYRTGHMVYLLSTCVLQLNGSWYEKMTYWGYILLTVQSIICWVMLIVATVSNRMLDNSSTWCISKCHCVYWALNAASNATSFLITIIFWAFIFVPSGAHFTASTFFVHGSNSILTLLDLCVTAHPVHLLHCLYPLIFCLGYLTFNISFYFYNRERGVEAVIYNFLDWSKPGKSVGVLIGILILLIILHGLTFGIYKLRDKITT